MTLRLVSAILIFVIVLQTRFCRVACDFRVRDQTTNEIVFQTASDFVRTGCGTFLNKSSLVVSEPLDACEIPTGPPVAPGFLSSLFNEEEEGNVANEVNHSWTLLVSGDGNCNLKTKLRNAASAGYSGIIVGSDETHSDIFLNDDEEFIDLHLVNPLDIRVLSENFSYEKRNFKLDPPTLQRCKQEYQRTWLRSRYVAAVIRVWRRCMETIWIVVTWILNIMGKLTLAIKAMMPSVLGNRDTFSSITLSLASLFISITIVMILSIQNTAKKMMKYKSFQQQGQGRSSSTSSGSSNSTNSTKKENVDDSNNNEEPGPSFRPQFPKKQYTKDGIPIDYTLYHRINLDIKLKEPLTKARIYKAFKEMALKYHPDKNRHLAEKELEKITEEFRKKKKSRDILLLYCID